MFLSYRWLCAMLGHDPGLERVRSLLTNAGVEVESVRDLGAGAGKIVAARILTRQQHPNADRLSLCDVDAGPALGTKRIVCGAQNMGPGDMVPLALEGAVLPGDFVIKKSKIRGEASEGMMCSGKELGLGEDHSGLLLLPSTDEDSGPYGRPLYPLGAGFDAILEVKPTANRGDCLNMRGLLRELRAGLRGSANGLSGGALPPILPGGATPASESATPCSISVSIADPAACGRYLGRVVKGGKIGPSPRWMQRVLEAAGLRPINNVVDATNYILLECGQPLHAFDLAKVRGGRIEVRRATAGETLSTLDGQQLSLEENDVVIADGAGPVALAGVMGGLDSAISDSTTDLFIECAVFDPVAVRRTSRRLGKITDSSQRFERGIDATAMDEALDRAVRLIVALGGGLAEGPVATAEGKLDSRPVVEVNLTETAKFLGMDLTAEESRAILESLDFAVETVGPDPQVLRVTVPGHRHDISRPVDLAEELARVAGYDRVPALLPPIRSRAFTAPRPAALADAIRKTLVEAGLHEAVSLSLTSNEVIQRLGFAALGAQGPALRNAISADLSIMRPSLVPGLLEAALHNQNHGADSVRLFETGRVFHRKDGRVEEPLHFAFLLSGGAGAPSWRPVARMADFFDAKSIVESLSAALVLETKVTFEPLGAEGIPGLVPPDFFHPGKSAVVRLDGAAIGAVGELHPALLPASQLRRAPQIGVLELGGILAVQGDLVQSRLVSEFPPVTRDLALLVPDSMPAETVVQTIRKAGLPLLQDVRLFDVYQGKGVADGYRSLAYALQYGADDRTLRDEEVQQAQEAVLQALGKIGVTLRGAA